MPTTKESFSVPLAAIRTFAIVAVVSLHVTDAIVNRANYLGGISWWFANFINSLSRVAVPLFIMLSGYLILSNPKNFKFSSQLKRTTIRIGIPLIFWTCFYFLWRQKWWGESISFDYVSKKVLLADLIHLYFLVIIAGLYLITPFLKKFFIQKNKPTQLKIIIVSFSASVLATILVYKIPALDSFKNLFTLPLFYLGFYLTGYLLRNFHLNRTQSVVFVIAGLTLVVITALLNYVNRVLMMQKNTLFWSSNNAQYFSDYLSPNVILMSVAIFLLILNLESTKVLKNRTVINILKHLSFTALGVYLLHPFVIDLLDHYANMAIHLIENNLWLYIIKKIFLVYIISHGAVLIYRFLSDRIRL